jgi:hypothetical protein
MKATFLICSGSVMFLMALGAVVGSSLGAGIVSSDGKLVVYTVPTCDDEAHLYSEVKVRAWDGSTTKTLGKVSGQWDGANWIGNKRIVLKESENIFIDSLAVWEAAGKRSPDLVMPAGCRAFYLALSPDGEKVAFTGQRAIGDKTQYGLFVWYPKQGEVKPLIEDNIKSLGAWSPDSRKLAIGVGAYVRNYPLRIVDVATGKVEDTGALGVGASWSPDGTLIACTTAVRPGKHGAWFEGVPQMGKLGIYDVQRRTMREVEETDGAVQPTWSGNGEFIAYVTDRGIGVAKRDGCLKTFEVQIDGSLLHGPLQVAWANGQRLYVRTASYLGCLEFPKGRFSRIAEWEKVTLAPLTQQQMYEDYDALTNIIEQVFPLMEVNRQIYSTDIHGLLSANRKELQKFTNQRTVSQSEQFAELINRTIVGCRGSHFWIVSPQKADFYQGFVDDDAYRWGGKYLGYLRAASAGAKIGLPALYFKGDYYTMYDLTCAGHVYPRGLKLLTCNGKTPDEIAGVLAQSGVFVQWDYDLHKYYTTELYRAGTNPVVSLQLVQTNGAIVNLEFGSENPPSCRPPKRDAADVAPLVTLVNSNILYIRLPAMDPGRMDFYEKQLAQYQKKPVQKVVIDIRDNGGGSDGVWNGLLSLLIDRKLTVVQRLAVKQSEINRQYLPRHDFGKLIEQSGKTEAIAFLNQETFQVYEATNDICPDTNSLNLACKMFVLSDHIYSSAGSFMNICKQDKRLVSVGVPNAMILGCGIDPFAFSLPHSKLVFTIEPVLDLTDTETARDTQHIDVEVRIEPTLEQLLDYYNTGSEVELEKRLNEHDPFFQEVVRSRGEL